MLSFSDNCWGHRSGLLIAWTKDQCTQLNIADLFSLKKIGHIHMRKHFTKGKCISLMLSKCNMLTLLIARPCSSVARMWRDLLPLGCLHALWILLPPRQESWGADPRGRPPPSPHTCMFQGPRSRQFTHPWSDTLIQYLTLSLTAVLESVVSRPVGWIAHKSVGKSAHGCERWVLRREIRRKAAKQGKCPFTAKMRPFIRRLSASQTSEHFLLKLKDGAFCMLILKM